jgi:hypothetical protein
VFVHLVLIATSALFLSLEDEDALADVLNKALQSAALSWRLVRTA